MSRWWAIGVTKVVRRYYLRSIQGSCVALLWQALCIGGSCYDRSSFTGLNVSSLPMCVFGGPVSVTIPPAYMCTDVYHAHYRYGIHMYWNIVHDACLLWLKVSDKPTHLSFTPSIPYLSATCLSFPTRVGNHLVRSTLR